MEQILEQLEKLVSEGKLIVWVNKNDDPYYGYIETVQSVCLNGKCIQFEIPGEDIE